METILPMSALAEAILRSRSPNAMRTKIVAIDGRGGAGKSTLAERIASALGDAPIVQTDDFASWENPFDWWPQCIEQVLRPLSEGGRAVYRRNRFNTREHGETVEIDGSPEIVVLEGVSASRLAFDSYLAFRIWVEAPAEIRLARGLERDGTAIEPQWRKWMEQEDAWIASEHPMERADLVVSGEPRIPLTRPAR